jgi:translation initiation factor 2-alpha kinase 4
VLNQLHVKQNFKQVRQHLLKHLEFSQKTIDILESFVSLKGPLSDVRERIAGLLRASTLAQEGWAEMEKLLEQLSMFSMGTPVIVDLSLAYNHLYYKDRTMFQASLNGKHLDIVAGGGRYDALVQHFKHPNSINQVIQATGVSFALGKIHAECLSAVGSDRRNRTQRPHMEEFSQWDISSMDVFVASFGFNLLPDRIQLCQDLWASDIRADYMLEDGQMTQEELVQHCKLKRVPILAIIKRTAGGAVKVKSIREVRPDQEVAREDLPEYIQFLLNEQVRTDSEKMSPHRQGRRERFASGSRDQNEESAAVATALPARASSVDTTQSTMAHFHHRGHHHLHLQPSESSRRNRKTKNLHS